MSTATRRLFSLLLITLFTVYYINITLFPHSHHDGGVVIVHSHFYAGTSASGEPEHNHTRSRFIIISDLSLFLTTALLFTSLVLVFQPESPFQYSSVVVTSILSFRKNIFQPRAPPVPI